MSKMAIVGAIFLALGAIGLVYPYITTQHTEDVAKVGDFKIQTTEREHHRVPQALAGGLLVLGVVLVVAGIARKPS